MSDQREMTLDEYLESRLPDFHLARRQLQDLREERDALAALVGRLREAFMPGDGGTDGGRLLAIGYVLNSAPTTSLSRQKMLWQAEALERLKTRYVTENGGRSRRSLFTIVDDEIEQLRRQAEGGERW